MDRQYVCHHEYDGMTLSGQRVSIMAGDRLTRHGDVLVHEGRPVCVYRSLIGKQHFAPDHDGRGLQRGAMTYAIAYAPRRVEIVRGGQRVVQRFADDEIKILLKRWPDQIKPNCDYLLFADNFFEADIKLLKKMAKAINIKSGEKKCTK